VAKWVNPTRFGPPKTNQVGLAHQLEMGWTLQPARLRVGQWVGTLIFLIFF